jgi:PE family
MAYVIAAPEMMTAAASDLATIASNVSAAHIIAAAPTTALVPAAADEVSAGIAHLFSQHAQGYQALAGQAAAFHEQFVQHLTASAGAFAHAEAANVALLQPLTASAASIGSAIGALQGQLLNLWDATTGQLLNLLTGFQNMLTSSLLSLLIPLFPIVVVFAFFGLEFFTFWVVYFNRRDLYNYKLPSSDIGRRIGIVRHLAGRLSRRCRGS